MSERRTSRPSEDGGQHRMMTALLVSTAITLLVAIPLLFAIW